MQAEGRRIYIAGRAIDMWDNPQASFSWTPSAIKAYVTAEKWESVFNALILLADSDPKGIA